MTENETFIFRFSASNECLRLKQEQLDRIPYLLALVTNDQKFLSNRNKDGEYVLNPPIHYHWFMPIFRSIISQQPYMLFNELPRSENILDVLQLFDYLSIDAFGSPLLQDEKLVLWNPVNDIDRKAHIKYYRASLSEARNTATQFLISISKNECDLKDSDTVKSIFNLILIIFSNNSVFSSRFRHHTLTIVEEYCLSIFSKSQWHQFPTRQELLRSNAIDSWMYLYDDEQSLPKNFENAFACKGTYTLTEENDTSDYQHIKIQIIGEGGTRMSIFMDRLIKLLDDYYSAPTRIKLIWSSSVSRPDLNSNYIRLTPANYKAVSINEKCPVKQQYISEAQSALSGRFNTLPKRPHVDKFKKHQKSR